MLLDQRQRSAISMLSVCVIYAVIGVPLLLAYVYGVVPLYLYAVCLCYLCSDRGPAVAGLRLWCRATVSMLSVCVIYAVIGVPLLLAYVYGVVPLSLCRSVGGCGIRTTSSGVRINVNEEDDSPAPGSLSMGPFQSTSNVGQSLALSCCFISGRVEKNKQIFLNRPTV